MSLELHDIVLAVLAVVSGLSSVILALSNRALKGEMKLVVDDHNADPQAHAARFERHNLTDQAHPNLHGTARLEEKFDAFREALEARINELSEQITALAKELVAMRASSSRRGKVK